VNLLPVYGRARADRQRAATASLQRCSSRPGRVVEPPAQAQCPHVLSVPEQGEPVGDTDPGALLGLPTHAVCPHAPRQHYTELHAAAAALQAQLDAINDQAASDNDPALITELPYAPGFLATAPDPVKENLYAALGIQCLYRPGKRQVTIRATITNTTPGIVAALPADPRTGSDNTNEPQCSV
jgi:hypothetical protein